MKTMRYACAGAIFAAMSVPSFAEARLVPEVDFLTWPATRYQHYYETSNYIAESWRKLGIPVKLNPQPFPAPMLGMWFTEHKFDVVMSVLSGGAARLDPEFYAATQFWSGSAEPGGMNVGGFVSPEIDALILEQRKIYDPEERRKVIYQLQAALQEEQPEGLIASMTNTHAINTQKVSLEGFEDSPNGIFAIWNLMRLVPKQADQPVKIGWTIDQESWNPLTFKSGDDLDRLGLVYDRLFVTGIDGNPVNWAASSMRVVDEKTIEVTLKDGLQFSDGKPVRAQDVSFTYQFLRDHNAIYFKSLLSPMESVTSEGDIIRFKLKDPAVQFVTGALSQIPILPEHIWKNITQEKGLAKPQEYQNTELVGSGPYRLKYWKEGREIYFEHKPDHFMKPPSDILMVQFGSSEVLAASLRTGTIDVTLQGLVPTVVEEFSQDPNLRLLPAKANSLYAARYNMKTELFTHKAVRQALSHAIPYEAIIDDVLGGFAEVTPSPIVPSNKFWSNPQLKLPEYDLEKARMILKDAGFSWNDKGALQFPQ